MIEDGLVLFYIKDGKLYPVALTEDQKMLFDMCMASISRIESIKVMGNLPQGEVVSLLDKEDQHGIT